ncbi:hypothetical protein [Kutzneria kofuensis]|uniref:DUF3806 domain-containing protein n=1 Tax=Kutzneria kofuensis TaxID=103725 RepID=A0A7W9KLY7_9PSEU|nr:hypothetical protein [Kutzneria kofuensis]MBB5895020.1 hypothetical protein [Kutzneria kofuensis]
MSPNFRHVAEQCVALVADKFSRRLDFTVDSLGILDSVCAELLTDGPLSEARLDLWWKLVGAYTGEVLIEAYGGSWSTHDQSPNPVVVIKGHTAMPFTIAERVLTGEPFKSLASFARAFPMILARSEQ